MIAIRSLWQPALFLPACLVLGLAAWSAADWWIALPRDREATFVGRQTCAQCHAAEVERWNGSDHDRAMEIATEESVLGDFNDSEFTWIGVTTRFFRRDGKYMVNTEGADGKMHDYEIKYTFGIDPLQQYMVEFPDGRVQVLSVSWDINRKEWFMVTPPDVPDERILPGDPLHWTGVAQNWNTMCAECHSTDVHKNFDLATNTYHTTFSEIDVSCETCHGPGSIHVELAESSAIFWDRIHGYGLPKLKGANAVAELETCAPCHSRRSQIHVDYHQREKFLDLYKPALLDAGLYYPDGQIRDEVYVYGSFQQSKMFAQGVRCVDCHDPHSLDLKFEGNQLCGQCHVPGKYDGPNHHHHKEGPATQCVTCHMPTNRYMVIDDRHDHSIRVPRPDLSDALGTPNVCTDCHQGPDENNAWAAEAIRKWYGKERPGMPSFGEAFLAGQQNDPQGLNLLRKLVTNTSQPDIVRATGISLLQNYPSQSVDAVCRELMDDPSPLVRAAATESLSGASIPRLVHESEKRLDDPIRLVRLAGAQRIVSVAAQVSDSRYRAALDKAIPEYRDANSVSLDRAASHLNLATLAYALGKLEAAKRELETAIRLEPYLTGPREQLANLLTEMGGNADDIKRLREEEIKNLERDATLLPDDAHIPYRRGMLHYLLGNPNGARRAFEEACWLDPTTYDNWLALALICEGEQDWDRAYEALAHMNELRPNDRAVRDVFQRIQQARATQDVEGFPGTPEGEPPEP
jgi:tetratricopeptide (TPR) repeat protein